MTPSASDNKKMDPTDLYWLVYLVFFLIEPIRRHSAQYWAECLLIMGLFLAIYLVFLKRGSVRVQLSLLAAMVALGAATMPFNGGATAFIIYASALIAFVILSPAAVLLTVLLLATLVGAESAWLHMDWWGVFLNVFFTLVVGCTNLHFAQKHRSDYKLRMQQEEIEALAAVAERERIARDLHDVLGHTLSVIVLKAELANRLLQRELANPVLQRELATTDDLSSRSEAEPSTTASSRPEAAGRSGETPVFHSARAEGTSQPEDASLHFDLSTLQRAQTEIADVERTARTALAEVREAIGGYRARGLAAEVEAARQTLHSAGVTLTTEGDLYPASLSAAEETVLSLALREAVTNIVRHAQASTCRLRLINDHGRYRLSIQDNGQNHTTREGNGLRGMRERVEALGGHLSLTREAGTHLQLELPQRAI